MYEGLAVRINRASEDVDLYIHELLPFKFFGTTIYITSTHICTVIIMAVICIFAVVARRSVLKTRTVPSKFATGVEMLVGMLINFVDGTMSKPGKKYLNYIGTLFLFIFLSNISGLFGLRPPTADYGVTLCLALVSFIMIQYAALRYKKLGAFTDLFQPIFLFFPVNVISEMATPVSLSLRLFGNVLAGTIMMALYYALIPSLLKLGIPSALHVYFDLFSGAIQAYVFCMLTMVFVSDKRDGK